MNESESIVPWKLVSIALIIAFVFYTIGSKNKPEPIQSAKVELDSKVQAPLEYIVPAPDPDEPAVIPPPPPPQTLTITPPNPPSIERRTPIVIQASQRVPQKEVAKLDDKEQKKLDAKISAKMDDVLAAERNLEKKRNTLDATNTNVRNAHFVPGQIQHYNSLKQLDLNRAIKAQERALIEEGKAKQKFDELRIEYCSLIDRPCPIQISIDRWWYDLWGQNWNTGVKKRYVLGR